MERYYCVECKQEFFLRRANMNEKCPVCGSPAQFDWGYPLDEDMGIIDTR